MSDTIKVMVEMRLYMICLDMEASPKAFINTPIAAIMTQRRRRTRRHSDVVLRFNDSTIVNMPITGMMGMPRSYLGPLLDSVCQGQGKISSE